MATKSKSAKDKKLVNKVRGVLKSRDAHLKSATSNLKKYPKFAKEQAKKSDTAAKKADSLLKRRRKANIKQETRVTKSGKSFTTRKSDSNLSPSQRKRMGDRMRLTPQTKQKAKQKARSK